MQACTGGGGATYQKDGHERRRLREERTEAVSAAEAADHREPEKEIVHPRHDVGVHVAQTAGMCLFVVGC